MELPLCHYIDQLAEKISETVGDKDMLEHFNILYHRDTFVLHLLKLDTCVHVINRSPFTHIRYF